MYRNYEMRFDLSKLCTAVEPPHSAQENEMVHEKVREERKSEDEDDSEEDSLPGTPPPTPPPHWKLDMIRTEMRLQELNEMEERRKYELYLSMLGPAERRRHFNTQMYEALQACPRNYRRGIKWHGYRRCMYFFGVVLLLSIGLMYLIWRKLQWADEMYETRCSRIYAERHCCPIDCERMQCVIRNSTIANTTNTKN